jgi:hypothetical protein
MEETTSILDTKVNDLTVKQAIVFQLVAPLVVVGGMIGAGALYAGAMSIIDKVRKPKDSPVLVTNENE